jgi:hypothetical protein
MKSPPAPWPLWQKILAYVVLSAVSLGAIWLVDLKVTRQQMSPGTRHAE